jgi:hypothetical protein
MVRDTALSVSGLLVTEVGGASVRPYQPAGYYRHLNFPPREYKSDTDLRQWRRGVYVHWQRQYLHPLLKALDAPSREECTAQRPKSNTPLAALVMLNDPTMVEAARVFAVRTLQSSGAEDARIESAFQRATSRLPDAFERQALGRLLAAGRANYRQDPRAAQEIGRVGLTPPAANVDPVELAAWIGVCRAILNLNETISRN